MNTPKFARRGAHGRFEYGNVEIAHGPPQTLFYSVLGTTDTMIEAMAKAGFEEVQPHNKEKQHVNISEEGLTLKNYNGCGNTVSSAPYASTITQPVRTAFKAPVVGKKVALCPVQEDERHH